jgi:hypothetical protein
MILSKTVRRRSCTALGTDTRTGSRKSTLKLAVVRHQSLSGVGTNEGIKADPGRKSRKIKALRGGGGAGCRNRTRDIQFTKLALYQLS